MKILIFFITFFVFFLNTYANSQKLEDVFLDISKEYEYYDLLQNLYDKGMIKPDEESKLSPNKPLTRDEFVGIIMEVSCIKCIKPDTSIDLISKYKTPPYYDILKENKYFYCISEAKQIETVKGYDISHKCEDGTFKSGESPFCIKNTITLEEALAFLLRNSSIFKVSDNENIKALIRAGAITDKLSNDIGPKNSDGSVYTFYGYFKKRLEVNYLEYDIYGNEKKISLLEKDSYGNLNPKKIIKKSDFIRMSYIVSKMNSCKIDNIDSPNKTEENKNALQIEIYNKECKVGEKNCKKSDLTDEEGKYDFGEEYKTTCEKGVKGYNWYFYNNDTKESDTINKEYIDNYKLKNYGKRTIKLEVTDNCGNKTISTLVIDYKKENNALSVVIDGKPIQGIGPLNVDLNSIIGGCENNCKYNWNFGDRENSKLEDEKHIFKYPGNYTVELEITRDDGKKAKASIVVSILDKTEDVDDLSTIDMDKDGVFDDKDKCILILGVKENSGCPILDNREKCLKNSEINTCNKGYTCNNDGFCEYVGINKDLVGTCLYPKSGSSIFGNAICDTCPCNYNLDFLRTIRKCDNLVPAIVSPDGQKVFSFGNTYIVGENNQK